MAMGTRKGREKQEDLWVAHTELAVAPGHPFYQRPNELLDSEGFDAFVEARCAKSYAARYGRPSLTPGIYFRSLLIGYLKAPQPSAALRGGWRCAVLLGLCWTSTHRVTRRFHARVGCSISRRIAKSSTGCSACSPIAGC